MSYKPYVKRTFKIDVDSLPPETSNDDQNDEKEDTFDTCNSNVQKYKIRAKARTISLLQPTNRARETLS